MKRRIVIGAALVVAAAAGVAVVATLPDDGSATDRPPIDSLVDSEIITVTRGDLRADVEFVGEASFG